MKRVNVPADSPAELHYLLEGWIEVARRGLWATLVKPA